MAAGGRSAVAGGGGRGNAEEARAGNRVDSSGRRDAPDAAGQIADIDVARRVANQRKEVVIVGIVELGGGRRSTVARESGNTSAENYRRHAGERNAGDFRARVVVQVAQGVGPHRAASDLGERADVAGCVDFTETAIAGVIDVNIVAAVHGHADRGVEFGRGSGSTVA